MPSSVPRSGVVEDERRVELVVRLLELAHHRHEESNSGDHAARHTFTGTMSTPRSARGRQWSSPLRARWVDGVCHALPHACSPMQPRRRGCARHRGYTSSCVATSGCRGRVQSCLPGSFGTMRSPATFGSGSDVVRAAPRSRERRHVRERPTHPPTSVQRTCL